MKAIPNILDLRQIGLIRNIAVLVAGFCILNLISSCRSSISLDVTARAPVPLIESIPISIGVLYGEKIDQFIFEDDTQGKYRIDFGSSQVEFFRKLFDSMFAKVVEVDSLKNAPAELDALIRIGLDEMQIATPKSTQNDFYEVWLRYSLDLHQTDGTIIYSWPVAAYGRSDIRNFSNIGGASPPALSDATSWALRDAAATISLFFAEQPAIENWLEGRDQ